MADPEQPKVENTEEGEEVEMVDGEGDQPQTIGGVLAGQLMQNPGVLAAIQGGLANMIGQPGGYIQSLPKVVKRRIKALKKMQFETTKIEAKFYEEVHQLECKYASLYSPLYEKRSLVLSGKTEPTDEECEWPSDDEEEELAVSNEELKTKATVDNEVNDKENKDEGEKEKKDEEEENPAGIPYFWLTVFKNVEMLSDMIQDHDEPIFKHLTDIRVKYCDVEPYGFTLEFHFEPNEYFSNTILTKDYTLRTSPEEGDPFSYEGPEIIKCKGCTIDWKKGKNVTQKTIKKVQKHKGKPAVKRTIMKTVQNDSFFNFFSPPEQPEAEGADLDEDTEVLLSADFEIGHFIRERIIPRAVLYFTGEALEDDDDDYEEEGEEEDDGDDDDDENEDNDPDFVPTEGQKPQECKQQ